MTGDINRKRAHFEVDDVDNNKIKRTEDRKRKPEKEYQSQQSEEAKTLFSKIVSSTGRSEKYELVLPLKIIKIIVTPGPVSYTHLTLPTKDGV